MNSKFSTYYSYLSYLKDKLKPFIIYVILISYCLLVIPLFCLSTYIFHNIGIFSYNLTDFQNICGFAWSFTFLLFLVSFIIICFLIRDLFIYIRIKLLERKFKIFCLFYYNQLPKGF